MLQYLSLAFRKKFVKEQLASEVVERLFYGFDDFTQDPLFGSKMDHHNFKQDLASPSPVPREISEK